MGDILYTISNLNPIKRYYPTSTATYALVRRKDTRNQTPVTAYTQSHTMLLHPRKDDHLYSYIYFMNSLQRRECALAIFPLPFSWLLPLPNFLLPPPWLLQVISIACSFPSRPDLAVPFVKRRFVHSLTLRVSFRWHLIPVTPPRVKRTPDPLLVSPALAS